jgi:hypothetical protein
VATQGKVKGHLLWEQGCSSPLVLPSIKNDEIIYLFIYLFIPPDTHSYDTRCVS